MIWTIALICASALGAGIVNAVAGGGTLLTFPALLALLSPVAANATSTCALLPGSLSAAFGFRTELRRAARHLVLLWPPSLVGGIIGSLLLIRMPESIFAGAVPWLLITASVLLLLQRPLMRYIGVHPSVEPGLRTRVVVVAFQLLVGIYGGYFGAGIGILMLSSLAFMGIHDIHEMNAVKNILAATMNGVSVVIFILAGVIVWKYAAIMAVAAIVGAYASARVARRVKANYVRAVVAMIGFLVAAWSFRSL
jgi:uncharacterized membrane protein YfcA